MRKSIILEMTTTEGRGEPLPPKMRKIGHGGCSSEWGGSSNEDVIFVSAQPGIEEEIVIKQEPFKVKEEILSDDEEDQSDEEEEDEVETVETLLSEWELEYELRPVFAKFKITLEVMQNLREEDLKVMLPDRELATRVLFRTYLTKWQKQNKYGSFEEDLPSTTSASVHANPIPSCSSKITTWEPPIVIKRKVGRKAAQRMYEEAKSWLQTHTYPWFEAGGILTKWHQSFYFRRTSFMSSDEKGKILNQWPILWNATGHKLIESDFNQIYANKSRCLFDKWDKFYTNLIPMLDTDIMETYGDELTTLDNKEMQNCLACQLINSFIEPSIPIFIKMVTGKGKVKTNYYRPSIHNARTSFFNVVLSEQDARAMAAAITNRYHALGLSRQPLIFGIGCRDDLVRKFVVIYDQLYYTVKSFLKALDIVFKMYHVFNLEYNRESQLMWVFIQRYFYDIVMANDVKSDELNEFIARLLKCTADTKED